VLEVNGPSYSPLSSNRARAITAYAPSMVPDKDRPKTRILDAGVNTTLFRPDPAARETIRNRFSLGEIPVVEYVGSFQPWHGVDDLVTASGEILKTCPTTKFLMVGPGYEKAKALVEELGVASSFIFVGPVPYHQVGDFINAGDILVSPTNPAKSEWTRVHGPPEQFKIFEYMACEKPVIATSVGPMQRIVRNGETGITFPPGDIEGLVQAVCTLIGNKELAKRLATCALQTVNERYTWSNHARLIYDIAASTQAKR